MANRPDIDGVLVTWGDRLFYPANRRVTDRGQPRLRSPNLHQRAAEIRARIEATVVRRAPQVMVKVTGGGRGMRAIVAHFRYISKNGRLEMEDELENKESGRRAVGDVAEDWRVGGTPIDEVSDRREAFNIMLSMPRGTDPASVLWAAREFARTELSGHKYVMVLHDHQANPHVHVSVRAESKTGRRMNPRKTDLHRWRETFAEKLRERGIDAEATRQPTRRVNRNYPALWRKEAERDGRLGSSRPRAKDGAAATASREAADEAWREISTALSDSADPRDRQLAASIASFARQIDKARPGRAPAERAIAMAPSVPGDATTAIRDNSPRR